MTTSPLSLWRSRAVLGVGQRALIRVNLVNYGAAAWPDLRVYLRIDGQNQDASALTLAPHQKGQVVFTHTFTESGSHVLEAYAEADPLQTDNVMRYSISVWDRLEVLLVSGDTNSKPMKSETAFLQIALQPFAAATADTADLMRATVVTPDKVNAELVASNRVIVLANVPKLTEAQIEVVRDFVQRGGGLLVFPGDRIDAAWYNQHLAGGTTPLLPCEFANVVTADPRGTEATGSPTQNSALGSPAQVVAEHYEDPALALFNDPGNGSLAGIRVHSRYRLRADAATTTTTTLARLDSGEPFLIEHGYGQGHVIQCCTACDADWSNLPMRPCYLPLMQQLVTHLASTVYPPRNLDVGDKLAAVLRPELAGQTVTLTDPQGRQHQLQAVATGHHSLAEYADTHRPGLYVLQTPDGRMTHFVVNASRRESDLKVLDDEQFKALAAEMNCRAVSSAAEYLQLDKQRRFGREVWKPLLTAVLVLLLAELLLQQRFAGVRR